MGPEQDEFAAKFIKDVGESAPSGGVGSLDCQRFAERLDDQIDRTVVKMEAAIAQTTLLRRRSHVSLRTRAEVVATAATVFAR